MHCVAMKKITYTVRVIKDFQTCKIAQMKQTGEQAYANEKVKRNALTFPEYFYNGMNEKFLFWSL